MKNEILGSSTFRTFPPISTIMSNEVFDKFLLKLFEKTADKGEISYYNRYEIGKELGLLDKTEVDRIVKILVSDGSVANNEITDFKIRITDEGKKRMENNQI